MAATGRIDIVARTISVRDAERQLGNIDRRVGGINAQLGRFRNLVNSAFAAAAFAGVFISLGRVSDAFTNIQSRIRLVVRETGRLVDVQDMVRRVALATRTAYEDTARLFSRIAIAGREAGVSIMETLQITRTFNEALIVSGASVAEQTSAILQFSQAFASGVLQGEELRALRESAPLVAEAFARELGGSIEDLKSFAEQGLITRDIMRSALRRMAGDVRTQFSLIQRTIGQSVTNFRTQFTQWVGEMNEASGAARGVADAIQLMADNMDTLVRVLGSFGASAGAALLLRLFGASGAVVAGGAAAIGGGALSIAAGDALSQQIQTREQLTRNLSGLRNRITNPNISDEEIVNIESQIARVTGSDTEEPQGSTALSLLGRFITGRNVSNQEREQLTAIQTFLEEYQETFREARRNLAIPVIASEIQAGYEAAAGVEIFGAPPSRSRAFTGTPQGLSPTRRALLEARNELSNVGLSERDQFIASQSGLGSIDELNTLIALGDEEARELKDTLGQIFDSNQAREYSDAISDVLDGLREQNNVAQLRLQGNIREAEIQENLNSLRRQGVEITDSVRASVSAEVDRGISLEGAEILQNAERQLEFRRETLGLTREQIEVKRIENALDEAGVRGYEARLEAYKRGLEAVSEEEQRLQSIRQVSDTVSRSIEDAFLNSADSIEDRFRNLASSVISQLSRIGIQQFITNPIAGALFGSASGVAGATGSGFLGRLLGRNQYGSRTVIPESAGFGDNAVFLARVNAGEEVNILTNQERQSEGGTQGRRGGGGVTFNIYGVQNPDAFDNSRTQLRRSANSLLTGRVR